MVVRKTRVPRGANPRQLALNALEQRLRKLPGFQLISKKDVTVGGARAVTVTVLYNHQGNIQYPRVIEEIYLVHGDEGFLLHFECFQPSVGRYTKDMGIFYGSFVPSPGGGSGVFDTDNGSQFPVVDQTPF